MKLVGVLAETITGVLAVVGILSFVDDEPKQYPQRLGRLKQQDNTEKCTIVKAYQKIFFGSSTGEGGSILMKLFKLPLYYQQRLYNLLALSHTFFFTFF